MATTQVTVGTSPTLLGALNQPGQIAIQNVGSATVSVADNPAMTNGIQLAGGTPGDNITVSIQTTASVAGGGPDFTALAGPTTSFYGTVESGSGTVEVMFLPL